MHPQPEQTRGKYPTTRSRGSIERPWSGKERSEQVVVDQVWKLLRIAVKAASPTTSGVPRASIMKLCPRLSHQMQSPPELRVRL